jgi:hypothetical protein
MIELTIDQVQALGKTDTGPQRIVNPQTREVFVLVPLADYGRLTDDEGDDDEPWTDEERGLLRAEACEMLDRFGKNQ